MDEPIDDTEHGGPRYPRAESIGASDLADALCRLPMLGDDLFLRMQAYNLSSVDHMIMGMEQEALRQSFRDDRISPDLLQLLSALTQMWIFASYELLRTWRSRIKQIIKWAENGGLASKLEVYERPARHRDLGNDLRASELRAVMSDPSLLDALRRGLIVTHVTFTRLHHLRITLAKHEIPNTKAKSAHMPGYARVNSWCGALEYHLSKSGTTYAVLCRRDIAEELRGVVGAVPQSADELAAFDAFMDSSFEVGDVFAEADGQA